MRLDLWIDQQAAIDRMYQQSQTNSTTLHPDPPVSGSRLGHLPAGGPYELERVNRRFFQVYFIDIEGVEMYRSGDLEIVEALADCHRRNEEWATNSRAYYDLLQEQWRKASQEWQNDPNDHRSIYEISDAIFSNRDDHYRKLIIR